MEYIGPVAGGALPNCRIRCNGTRIQVGSRDFTSATEALSAYLDQYSGLTTQYSSSYKRDVSDLLDPKSILHMTADRSLQTGIRDTGIEMKLADTKANISNTFDRMEKSSKLRAEGLIQLQAEDALNRSGELLYQIQTDELQKPSSDIGSVSTEALMTMNPTAGYSERKHVYSYKRPKQKGKYEPLTNRSDNANDFFDKRPPSSFNTRAGSIPLRERSRSVSPTSNRQNEKLFKKPQKWIKDPNVTDTKAPSWIDALDITDPAESLWSRRDLRSGRPPPSWVNGLEGSDITSLATHNVGVSELLGNDTVTSARGLKYDDLMKSPQNSRRGRGRDKFDLTSQLPREVMESGKNVNKSNDILEQYMDIGSDKKSDSILDSLKGDNRVPRCSSLDTEALIAGMSAPMHHEIAGASPITGTPLKPRRARSPDTDIVLEGDRPWEKQVAFKSPVYVDEDTSDSDVKAPTYTGRLQPGSLETLKNMLYKLQSEESGNSREKLLAAQTELNMSNEELEDALRDYNFEDEPGGRSLEKALSHLTKLKTLVKDGKSLRSRSPSPHVRLQSRSPSPHHRMSSKSPSRHSVT